MNLDNMDIKILKENFDDETISKIEPNNVSRIWKYLDSNNIYYAKDLFLNSLICSFFMTHLFFTKTILLKTRFNVKNML